jgi:hypothetical protein
MNEIDQNPDYKKIYAIVCDHFEKSIHFFFGPHDESYYTLRVYETAKEIINKIIESVEKEAILVSCLLHDIGKVDLNLGNLFNEQGLSEHFRKEWLMHPKKSVTLAQEILKELGHSDDFIDKCMFLIGNHDNRDHPEMTTELKIVQDADILADCGFAGFIRPFLYGAKFRRPVISSIIYMQKGNSRMREISFHLKISKVIAKRKDAEEKELISRIGKDIDSDVLDRDLWN